MRHVLVFGLCILGVACDSQRSISPTAPSIAATITATSTSATVTATQKPAGSNAPVEVTFTKWFTSFPSMAGVTGGDLVGTYAGRLLSLNPFDNGIIVELEALYEVIDPTGLRSFKAHIQGKQNNETGEAVLNGVVTEGWLVGAQVHVTFQVIRPCTAFGRNQCFQGTIRVMPGSAE